MIAVSTATKEPAGTPFVWFTAIYSVVGDIVILLLLAFEIEEIIVPSRFIAWPLAVSIVSFLEF